MSPMTTMSESIQAYLDERRPADWQQAEVARFRARLEEILESNFQMIGFFQSGSFTHGTAISPYSDVDYIARISFDSRPSSSTSALERLREVLLAELWEASEVYIARPTVTIVFPGVVARYEITPAYLDRSVGEEQVLVIPAAGGGWQEASPQAHRKFISAMDQKHSGSVKRLARLLKAWKYEQGVPISSFYLEMRAAELGKNEDLIWSLYGLRTILNKLVSSDLASMNDPAQLVSRIAPASSESNRRQSLGALKEFNQNLAAVLAEDSASGDRWTFNQRLQDIWGTSFPYTDPNTA